MGNQNRNRVILIGLLAVGIVISALSRFYVDWLWFESLSFGQVFTTTFITKWGVGIGVFLFTLFFVVGNLMIARRYLIRKITPVNEDGREIIFDEEAGLDVETKSRGISSIFVVFTGLGALSAALMAADKWIIIKQYFNQVPFNIADPIFNRDIAFFVFDLRLYEFVYGLIMPILIFTVIGVGFLYLMMSAFKLTDVDWKEFSWPKAHIIMLLGLIFAAKAWGYRLASYEIVYSSNSVVYGAGYTDVHARLIGFKILIIITLVVAALLLANIFLRKLNWVVVSLGLWAVAVLVFSGVYPAAVQKLSVVPNEFNREKPYIQNNIKYTREAYGLDKVENQPYDIAYDLTWNDIEANRATIQNIRLWDWQPLKKTYQAIQEIRPYYQFNDIDIDRYMINGEYRQVMLAPRELSQESVPQTWVNQKLKYTHGYGVSMSPVNEVGQEGLPVMFIKDIPPRSSVDLQITRPEIYFGEEVGKYVIVNSNTKEFDYPMGTTNAESVYKSDSGIKMGSIVRRLLLALELKDYKLLLSSDVDAGSQVLMYRNIVERVDKIAPFLDYDGDPYIVIDNGKIFWIIDAYTSSDSYPCSEPFDGHKNYIRNSVKIVIDAYSGDTAFYMADPNDPIVQSLAATFPGLFIAMDKMPEGLKAHIRYPEELFRIQATMYSLYHMTDPLVFYNKEDKWNIPQEIVGDKTVDVDPYYMIMQLPGEAKPEYILMLPFTPNTKQNMIGWLCARSDVENYGKLKVYDFPKQELIYGPMQIESRIDQNSEVSQQMTLWNQKGSRVYRGNLLVIPVKNSMMYVEPVYLQAEQSQIPELRRIIVVYGDTVVMEPTLEESLLRIFAPGGIKTEPGEIEPQPGTVDKSLVGMVGQAKEYFDKAQDALKSGDWTNYGKYIDEVGKALESLIENVPPTGVPTT